MSKDKPSDDIFEVTIEKIIYGGDGLARYKGQTVFVPFAAPGDQLRVRAIETRRNYKRAIVEEIISPSPFRREPPCEHFGICGGCQLQHINYQAQLESKVAFVRESLKRIGHIDWDGPLPIISGSEWGYRSRAQFKIDHVKNRIGFYKSGSHEIRDIGSCPLLRAELNSELNILRNDRRSFGGVNEAEIVAGDEGVSRWLGPNAKDPTVVTQRVGEFEYRFDGHTFFQVNPGILDKLLGLAIGDATGTLAVDLYSGVGLFTVPLSKRFEKVIAVEGNERSAKFAAQNLKQVGSENVDVYAKSVEDWTLQYASGMKSVDLLVIDPPRAGIEANALEEILVMKPAAVSYVSCDPTTLARDLRYFTAAGYVIQSITALDMFPQTYHVESIVKLMVQ